MVPSGLTTYSFIKKRGDWVLIIDFPCRPIRDTLRYNMATFKSHLRKIMKYLYLMIVLFALPSQGATILRLGTAELVNKSEIVFEGKVVNTRSVMNKQGRIYTFVKFHVRDVIVGSTTIGDQLELRFTGGIVNDLALDVGVRIPKDGESGVYFVERVRVGLINPLLGWDQGRFIIRDDGKVIAGNSHAVIGIKKSDYNLPPTISQGIAQGVITSKEIVKNESQSSPMTLEQFKLSIKALVNE